MLALFTEDGKLARIGNKSGEAYYLLNYEYSLLCSGFLAGIMRRYFKELAEDAGGEEPEGDTRESRRERKRKEQMEIQAILEEEGVLDELEGKQVNPFRSGTMCCVQVILVAG